MDYNHILDTIVDNIETVPSSQNYWLIRTQSGAFYDTFAENDFVGLDHAELSIKDLNHLRNLYIDDNKFLGSIKESLKDFYTDKNTKELTVPERRISHIANQVFKFYRRVKKGDIVIIPSFSSVRVSFGVIEETSLAEFNEAELRKFDTSTQFLNKRVKWIGDFNRKDLDPNIFKMFTSHQAINNVGSYADVIERTLHDFFVLDNEAHVVINVQQQNNIKARELFGLGYNFLELVDTVIRELEIEGVTADDFEVEVNINSPGKIDLKSKIKKGTVIAFCTLAVFGGGYESKAGESFKTDGLPGLIKVITAAISDFRDREQNRDMKMKIFNQYKDKLEVKKVDDMLKIMKQTDSNKDLPK